MALRSSIAALVGLRLEKINQAEIMEKIETLPGVTSVWRTTGRFDFFLKSWQVHLKN